MKYFYVEGKPVSEDDYLKATHVRKDMVEYILPYNQAGWICPRCGSVYGPNQDECIRCNPPFIPQVTC